jgi:outer membrane protein W
VLPALRHTLSGRAATQDGSVQAQDWGFVHAQPLMASLQWRPSPFWSDFHPYVGLGLCQLRFVKSRPAPAMAYAAQVEPGQAYSTHWRTATGPYLQLGTSYAFSPQLHMDVGASYLRMAADLESRTPAGVQTQSVRLNPLVFSTGFAWRF